MLAGSDASLWVGVTIKGVTSESQSDGDTAIAHSSCN